MNMTLLMTASALVTSILATNIYCANHTMKDDEDETASDTIREYFQECLKNRKNKKAGKNIRNWLKNNPEGK